MIDAATQLDRQYYEMRWRVLSLAADVDRIERLPGGAELIAKDKRIANLRACLEAVLSSQPDRAGRVQTILSDKTPRP